MAALIKGANGLKLYNPVASGAMRKATVQWQTNILVPSLRMCSGKDNVDKSVTQKVSGKPGESVPDTAASLHARASMRKLDPLHKYVMWFWGPKGKYKTVADVPDMVHVKEARNAFDKQRIYGCSLMMILLFIISYVTVKYEKYKISHSENFGERHWNQTVDSGNYVGQPRPPSTARPRAE